MWKIGGLGFLLAISGWLVLYVIVPPCFSGADVFNFKDAGINLASGLGFITRLNPGNPGIEPTYYASYTPLFPVVYGIFVKIFGVGPKVNKVFDFLLTASSGVIFWFVVQPRFCNRATFVPSIMLLLVLLVTLPVSPIGSEPERPEALSFILTVASWKFIEHRIELRNVLCAALLLGVNGMVMPFGFIINGMGLLFLYVSPYVRRKEQPLLSPLKFLMIVAIGVGVPIATGAIWVFLQDPSAIQRFFDHVTGRSIGGHGALGYFGALLAGDVKFYSYPFTQYNFFHVSRLIYLAAVTVIVVTYLVNTKKMRLHFQNYIYSLIIAIMVIIQILVFAYETSYFGMTAALLIVLLSCLTVQESVSVPKLYVWFIFICVLFISLVEFRYATKDIIVAWQSAASYDRMQQVVEGLRPSQGKPLLVATAPANYFLFKGCGYDVVDINYLSNPSDRDQVDLFGLSFVGSGDPMKPDFPPWGWDPTGLKLIYRPVLPQQTRFLGFVSSGSNTWEVELYQRR